MTSARNCAVSPTPHCVCVAVSVAAAPVNTDCAVKAFAVAAPVPVVAPVRSPTTENASSQALAMSCSGSNWHAAALADDNSSASEAFMSSSGTVKSVELSVSIAREIAVNVSSVG